HQVGPARGIASGQAVHRRQGVGRRQTRRHVETGAEAQGGRHGFEQVVERREADEREHVADLVVGMGNEVTQRQAPFLATNGSFTTRAGTGRLRTSISTSAPTSTAGGRKARAMPCSSIGEKFPLVTSPAGLPSTSTG